MKRKDSWVDGGGDKSVRDAGRADEKVRAGSDANHHLLWASSGIMSSQKGQH